MTTNEPPLDVGGCFVTRRQAVGGLIGAGLFVLLPMCALGADRTPEGFQYAGPSSRFKKHLPTRVKLRTGAVVFVIRVDTDRVKALSARCTHQGCEVGWSVGEHYFFCPCHGSQFLADGAVKRGPARVPLLALRAMEKNGEVFVQTPNRPVAE